jgi:hypothetical protein
MRQFLLRLALFCGLQSLLLGAFLWLTSKEVVLSATDAPHLSSEERIDRFLREYLFPMYRGDDRLLDDFLKSPPSIYAAVAEYLAGPNNFMATLIDKDERLKSAPGPRMIFVGGSGVAFGMDSQLIAERYAYTPVNYGLHAALGGDFMLKHVGEHLRPGDVVVLCMEHGVIYHLHFKTTFLREHLRGVTPVFDHYFDALDQQTIRQLVQWKQYCDSQAFTDLAVKVRARVTWCKDKLRGTRSSRDHFDAAFDARREALVNSLPQQALDGQYQRSAFNAFGDYQGHLRLADAAKPADEATWGSAAMKPENLPIMYESIDRINAFADECQAKGVQVHFTYPPLIKFGDYKEFAKEYSEVVEARLKLKPLYSIDETYFDKNLFFDSAAHLTWPGIRRRMTILAKALDQHFPVQTLMPVEVHLAERERRIFAEFPQTAARAGRGAAIAARSGGARKARDSVFWLPKPSGATSVVAEWPFVLGLVQSAPILCKPRACVATACPLCSFDTTLRVGSAP